MLFVLSINNSILYIKNSKYNFFLTYFHLKIFF